METLRWKIAMIVSRFCEHTGDGDPETRWLGSVSHYQIRFAGKLRRGYWLACVSAVILLTAVMGNLSWWKGKNVGMKKMRIDMWTAV